jgi:hypothetical protein
LAGGTPTRSILGQRNTNFLKIQMLKQSREHADPNFDFAQEPPGLKGPNYPGLLDFCMLPTCESLKQQVIE